MGQRVKIEIDFDTEQLQNSGITINVDGKETDIISMDNNIKSYCVLALDHWKDILYEDMFK